MNILHLHEHAFASTDRWCIYSHYARNEQVAQYVLFAIEKLKEAGFEVCFISTSKGISESALEGLKRLAACVAIRENIGYDFGSYKVGIELLSSKKVKARQLLLTNDSVFGPFNDLTSILVKATEFDIYGLTDSIDRSYHIQSYFIVYNQRILNSIHFSEFWNSVRLLSNNVPSFKDSIIDQYEVGGSQFFLKHGFRIGAAFSFKDIAYKSFTAYLREVELAQVQPGFVVTPLKLGANLTHEYWRELLDLGYPFLKRELLVCNPTKSDIRDWQHMLEKVSSYNLSYIFQGLADYYGGTDIFYTYDSIKLARGSMTSDGSIRLPISQAFEGFCDLFGLQRFRDFALDKEHYLSSNYDVKCHLDALPGQSAVEHFVLYAYYEDRPYKLISLPYMFESGTPIVFNIDSPLATEANYETHITFSGWAYSEAGPVTCVAIIGGHLVGECVADSLRPDVAEVFPQYANSSRSGFILSLDLDGLSFTDLHTLVIRFSDDDGNVVEEKREFLRKNDQLSYHRYYLAMKEADHSQSQSSDRLEMHFCIEYTNIVDLCKTLQSLERAGYSNNKAVLLAPRSSWGEIRTYFSDAQDSSPLLMDSIENSLQCLGNRDWVTLLKCGDLIDSYFGQQLSHAHETISKADAVVLDHDYHRDDGLHIDPHFKPAWSYHFYLAKDYVDGAYCARIRALQSIIDRFGSIAHAECWRYECLLKIHETGGIISGLQKVLISKYIVQEERARESSSHVECVKSHLERMGISAEVISLDKGNRKIEYALHRQPKVSIIVPTTGKIRYLRPLISSILGLTDYTEFELIVIDNGRGHNRDGIEFAKASGVRVLECFEPFNWSKLNNHGVASSEGELILFLNDDIEVVDPHWLTEMVRLISQNNVGAVGAMLLYPNNLIQHAGVFLVDHGGGARHYLQFLNPEQDLYMDYQSVVREVSATTGACLLVHRKIFLELRGFDEDLPIVGNDVDLCLRIRREGYFVLWTPESRLTHHESVSREQIEYRDDERRMWQRWSQAFLQGDPFYNKNLTLLKSDCSHKKAVDLMSTVDVTSKSIGVNIIGYFKAEMGLGQAVRGLARALEASSVCTQFVNYRGNNPARMGDTSFGKLITNELKFSTSIWNINPDYLWCAMHHFEAIEDSSRYNIGFWAWELPVLPPDWSLSVQLIDEVWVPSEFVADAVRAQTDKPVKIFPHPVTKLAQDYLNRKYFQLPEKCCIFLVAYDLHSIRQRKNPDGAISAFQKAFEKCDNSVMLLVKVSNATEDEVDFLVDAIGDYANIRIMSDTLDRVEMDSLLNAIDCFVSLHRSEGFGLAVAEALIMGKPVIATAWSGNMDFMDSSYPFLVGYNLIQLDDSYGPYDSGQYWADPDIDRASVLMKSISMDLSHAMSVADHERIRVQDILSPARIGALMADRISEINNSRISGSDS